jgi:hypothetical protein
MADRIDSSNDFFFSSYSIKLPFIVIKDTTFNTKFKFCFLKTLLMTKQNKIDN